MKKLCPRCKVEKELDQFYPDPRYKLGVQSFCRFCKNEGAKASQKKKRALAPKVQRPSRIQRLKNQLRQGRYNWSEKGRAARSRYNKTPEGRAALLAAKKRYRESPEGKAKILAAKQRYRTRQGMRPRNAKLEIAKLIVDQARDDRSFQVKHNFAYDSTAAPRFPIEGRVVYDEYFTART